MFRPLLLMCSLLLLGCEMPAQMVWSPDGSKAVYRVGSNLVIMDADGKMLTDRLQSMGGMAWTDDSKTAYVAVLFDPTDERKQRVEIMAWSGAGEMSSLFTLPGRPVWHMALSPDQNWLAVIQSASDESGDCMLHAFHLPTKKLMIVSGLCGVGMCFTGPSRVALIEPQDKALSLKGATGHIVEVQLKEDGVVSPERKKLVNVRSDETAWIRSIGDDLLFTSTAAVFPSRATTKPTSGKLFHYSRADGGLCAIAEEVGPLFSVSPDGKQILIEKITPVPARRELVLIRPNGSDGRVLRDLSSTPGMPMWPSWRGNSELAFFSQPDTTQPLRVDPDNSVRFDAVLYQLTEMFELQPVRTLSEAWPVELKPFFRAKAVAPSTRPTISPATQAAFAR